MHDVLRALALLNLLLPILPVLQVLTAVQQLSDDRGAGGSGEALGYSEAAYTCIYIYIYTHMIRQYISDIYM